MLSFKSFLTEARFGGSSVIRAASLLHRLLEKKLGQKLYRYDGENGFQLIAINGQTGKGLLLLTDGPGAFRLNFVGGNVDSISIWKTYTLDGLADFTLSLDGNNINQVIDLIVPLLQNPRAGEYNFPVNAGIKESVKLIKEARSEILPPHEFFHTIAPHLPHSDYKKMKGSDVYAAAKKLGIRVNTYYAKNKVGPNLYNIQPDGEYEEAKQAPADPNKTYHISITPQDMITKRFLSPKDDPRVAQITAEIRRTLANPTPTPMEMKDPDSIFRILADLVELIIDKHINSLIVYGGPGTGKTYTVVDMIKKAGLVEDKDWVHFQGAKVTASALYQLLFLHRNDELIVLDDADSAFQSEDAKNILKGALDTSAERKLSWISTRTINVDRMDQEGRDAFNKSIEDKLLADPADTSIKYPSKFVFTSRILFISNLQLKDFDTALISRSAKIDMTLTEEQTLRRIENNLQTIGDTSVPVEVKKEIIEKLRDAASLGQLSNITIRTFVKAIGVYKSGKTNWLELLDYT